MSFCIIVNIKFRNLIRWVFKVKGYIFRFEYFWFLFFKEIEFIKLIKFKLF